MTQTDTLSPIRNLTAIAGGIGSGKSVVSHMLRAMGYMVYDCDTRARSIMSREDIACKIRDTFGNTVFGQDGSLDRPALAHLVFADGAKLETLNKITHGAVRDDLFDWCAASVSSERIFVETAILYQSGIDRMASEVWMVMAPTEIRVRRVGERNGLSRDEILARIDRQDSFVPHSQHKNTSVIINDGITPVLPRIEYLLSNGRNISVCH